MATRRAGDDLGRIFGAESFVVSPKELGAKLERCRGVVLDWDGVVGPGHKGPDVADRFSEIDSMGLNLARFALWLRDGELPPVAIISGQRNRAAQALAAREHLDTVYLGFLDKRAALDHWCASRGLDANELVFVFDDVIDLALAERCGVRFLVARPAARLFEAYARSAGRCDYVVRTPAGEGAVREACEVILATVGSYQRVFAARAHWDETYRRYFAARQQVVPMQVAPVHHPDGTVTAGATEPVPS